MTGLACALTLQNAGYRVTVVEKSRGVGGRMATRHLPLSLVDHGAPTVEKDLYDESQYGAYIAALAEQKIVQPWLVNQIYGAYFDQNQWSLELIQPSNVAQYYAAPGGMTAIAKELAKTLPIELTQRVTHLYLDRNIWQIMTEGMTFQAKAVVVAVPAPQALDLCMPLVQDGLSAAVIAALQNVQFDPCITAIAGYPSSAPWATLPWAELQCHNDPVIGRMICDRHKREMPSGPCFAIHSTPAFAAEHFEAADLSAVGQQMLDHIAQVYAPWFAQPVILQVHRWRYAIATHGYPGHPLSANLSQPLWICGEWCVGSTIQHAFEVGLDVAQQLKEQLIDLSHKKLRG
jgi:renalase